MPHYNLMVLLIKREVVGRYRGSLLGFLWSFIHPIFMLAVYTFVFGFVFKARWGIEQENPIHFAAVLFTDRLQSFFRMSEQSPRFNFN
jgi:lipopolysaccharide transport system permease protein